MEYELEDPRYSLSNVSISIPYLGTPPNVGSVDSGDYTIDKSHRKLVWNISSLDKSNSSGCLEFNLDTDDVGTLYPIQIHFQSNVLFSGIEIKDISLMEGGSAKFSSEVALLTEGYEIA
jgi:hypothetical protein